MNDGSEFALIVSHEHKFIFLKTMKTAGTSIEVFLSKIAGADAIVTPLGPKEPGHEPRNFEGSTYWNHMPAEAVRASLGEEIWNGYLKFCFERNPWDKVISRYWWAIHWGQVRKMPDLPSLEEFVFGRYGRLDTDWPIYAIDDEIAVDVVGRYESLEGDLRAILGRTGLTIQVELPRTKSGFRAPGDPERFSARGAERVAELFHREIAAFGYECPPELMLSS
jgi:hypothetical protein